MILVTDFDDTFYPHSDPGFLVENLRASEDFRRDGNKLVLATGRSASSLRRVLPNFDEYFDYIIFDNGAVCVNQNEEIIFQSVISEELARQLSQSILKEFGDKVAFVYYHSAKEWPTLDHDVTKIRCWTIDEQIGAEILGAIIKEYPNQVQAFLARNARATDVRWIVGRERLRAFVDIMPGDASKEKAICHLASAFFDEEIVTVGDGTNDIGMLTKFNGYAVQNSEPEVLELISSDHIVPNVASLMARLI